MKAIVTGSAGFIGSHLVDSLLSDGWEVVGIDDYSAGKEYNIELARLNENFTQVDLDICSSKVEDWFEDIDVVFHQAASKKNICLKNPHRDLEVNGGGTLNLLQMAHKYKVRKFVHASTGSVYGEPVVFPQNEEHPLNPCSYYGVSKLAGERYVAMYARNGLSATILRYFHVFGARQDSSDDRGGVVSIFMRKALNGDSLPVFGTGEQQRSFTSVHDVVRANRFAVQNDKTNGEAYNVASGLQITVNELADAVSEVTGKTLTIKNQPRLTGDIDRFLVDNSKLKALGFEFQTDFIKDLLEVRDSLQPVG